MDENQLYKDAIKHWGNSLQIIMMMEEMSELQKELCKFFRRKTSKDKIALEMADVEIMLEQLKVMFKNHNLV